MIHPHVTTQKLLRRRTTAYSTEIKTAVITALHTAYMWCARPHSRRAPPRGGRQAAKRHGMKRAANGRREVVATVACRHQAEAILRGRRGIGRIWLSWLREEVVAERQATAVVVGELRGGGIGCKGITAQAGELKTRMR